MGMFIAIAITLFAGLFNYYVGYILQSNFGKFGSVLTELGFALIALFGAILYVTSMRKEYDRKHIEYGENDFTVESMFSFSFPRFKHILGGLILIFAGNVLSVMYFNIVMRLFPDTFNALTDAIIRSTYTGSFASIFCTVAIVPAVCEELLFRGAIQGSLGTLKKPMARIILTGILFGLFHIDPIRIPFAGVMGIILSYAYYKSGSIFVPIAMHFANNAYSAVASYATLGVEIPETQMQSISVSPVFAALISLVYTAIACGALMLGASSFEGQIGAAIKKHRAVFTVCAIGVIALGVGMFAVITIFGF